MIQYCNQWHFHLFIANMNIIRHQIVANRLLILPTYVDNTYKIRFTRNQIKPLTSMYFVLRRFSLINAVNNCTSMYTGYQYNDPLKNKGCVIGSSLSFYSGIEMKMASNERLCGIVSVCRKQLTKERSDSSAFWVGNKGSTGGLDEWGIDIEAVRYGMPHPSRSFVRASKTRLFVWCDVLSRVLLTPLFHFLSLYKLL